jgi:hypothetical protein
MCDAELDIQVHRDSVTWQQKSLNMILKQLREGGEAKNLHGEASLALHILRHTHTEAKTVTIYVQSRGK